MPVYSAPLGDRMRWAEDRHQKIVAASPSPRSSRLLRPNISQIQSMEERTPDTGSATVAVIGLGVIGLVTLKNLREHGFDATGYERNDHVGGLWQFKEDPSQVSVLQTTKALGGKGSIAYTDFPFPSDCPEFITAKELAEYLQAYARYNELLPYCKLNTSISRVQRSSTGGWELIFNDDRLMTYDKVIITTGPYGEALIPNISGLEHFQGTVMHSNAYKGPTSFRDKTILIVGFGPTAADIAVNLCETAKKVYISHRHGARLLPRILFGQPWDVFVSRFKRPTMWEAFVSYIPRVMTKVLCLHPPRTSAARWDDLVRLVHPDLKDEWRLLPGSPCSSTQPPFLINDDLIHKFPSGEVVPVSPIQRLTASSAILEDGQELFPDVIIFCTAGYTDYSILDPEADPTKARPADEWNTAPETNELPFPWLYQTVFHIDHPHSLAFLGACKGAHFSPFRFADIQSCAIARI